MQGNPNDQQMMKNILSLYSSKLLIGVLIVSCVLLNAQDNSKKRKVYRTQSGVLIQAPKPIFERKNKKSKATLDNVQGKAQKERKELEYKNRLESLESRLTELIEQSNNSQNDTVFIYTTLDTVFIYTTLYDTTTVFDTTFIYTNATTTNYDTVIISDSLYIINYDTTTIVNTNYDTVVVLDTTYLYTYDTTVVRDTVWAFAIDTVVIYDTSWVFAYDTTTIKDSTWVFAYDTTVVYDTLVIFNNDTVTIHTHSSNFTPDMADGQRSQFPKWKSLNDVIRARDTDDPTAQEWINQALYAAGGDWSKAGDEYLKFQKIYSSAIVKNILNRPNNNKFIGPEMKYRSVVFDTLKILSFDTLIVKDTIRDLIKETYVKYDTSVINKPKDVIAHVTPPGHELILKFYTNGNVKERGLMKGTKRNRLWIFYDENGKEIRKTTYENGKIIIDSDLNEIKTDTLGQSNEKPEVESAELKSKKSSKRFFFFSKRDAQIPFQNSE